MSFFSNKIVVIGLLGGLLLYWFMGDSLDWDVKYSPAPSDAIVAFGDSLTYGFGAKPTESYPVILSLLLRRDVVNLGENGLTTKAALDRIDRVIAENPSVVLITLTGNDIIRQIPIEETLSSLNEIFKRLHEREIMIVYVAIDPPFVRKERLIKIKDLCRRTGVLYVPNALSDLWMNSQLMTDQVHPNSAGYKIMAEKIYQRIMPHLK